MPGPRFSVAAARSGRIRFFLAVVLTFGGLAHSFSLASAVRRPFAGSPEAAVHLPARSLALPVPGVFSPVGGANSLSSRAPGSADPSERDREARWPGETAFAPPVLPVDSRRPARLADHAPAAGRRFPWLTAAPSTGPPLLA